MDVLDAGHKTHMLADAMDPRTYGFSCLKILTLY